MIEIKAFGELKDGGFWPRNPNVYMEQIRQAGNVNECVLTITGSNKRSPDQNNYAFAMCNVVAVYRQDLGWTDDAYDVYKEIEEDKCWTVKVNKETDETKPYLKPLKKHSPEEFWNIIEEARIEFMQMYGIHIKTPAEYYGMTEKAYDLWKIGAITFAQAKNMSDKELDKEIEAEV